MHCNSLREVYCLFPYDADTIEAIVTRPLTFKTNNNEPRCFPCSPTSDSPITHNLQLTHTTNIYTGFITEMYLLLNILCLPP